RGDGEVVRGTGGPDARVLLLARREMASEPGAEVLLLHDVTARDRATEERHRLDKLAEVMRTLAVLNHKINNPLTALMGRAQLLQLRKGDDPHVSKAAEVIEESAKRITAYLRELSKVVQEGREEALVRVMSMATPPGGNEG
ncbi:MAG TPA: histidine kinase dimerization/phospho-acceptor domain-containing protein, partial [Candidatus Polarisedimenticolaceae bacterium]|nr:histidine kinase dimerization/phospho-acceptor domain-containing protein [Candidatus Polarisedimenticolaceae bacterium]